MANIIGGFDTGLLDSSLYLLNRNDQDRAGTSAHGEELYVNISNGNLVLRHVDAYLPSQGEDFLLARTYNSRGNWNNNSGQGWSIDSIALELSQITNQKITLVNPDTSQFIYVYDAASDSHISVDGAGAYERITYDNVSKQYTLVRSDQTRLTFDVNGTLLKSTDTNGNTITYQFAQGKLQSVQDDTGHTISYIYSGSQLSQVKDETGAILVSYSYSKGLLVGVTDRAGHVTTYTYDTNGLLASVTLPTGTDGVVRTTSFSYDPNPIDNSGKSRLLRWITDAEGNRTFFEYRFNVDNFNKYNGGTTVMVNALGINRKESNATEYVNWRVANGYYSVWDANLYATNSAFKAQADAIAARHTVTYGYDKNGQITSVVDQKGYRTAYTYDAKENLIAITDANGYAITQSDDAYWRDLRRDYGYVDIGGQGKLVGGLSSGEVAALLERYTSHFEYDSRGNLTKRIDNADNVTTYTYTAFNKLATQTAAMGHALTTSDDVFYQDKRVELGYSASVAGLSSGDIAALLTLYTTVYTYDAKQNITEIKSPGGDLTRFAYDVYGNMTRRTVYLDAQDLVTASKQQVTQYQYDAYGNNIKIIDAEGNVTLNSFDHFGNLLTATDGRGGVTRYTYDNDNRVITATDPDGHVTTNIYDAVGNRVSVKDAAGHFVYFVYDRNNMLLTSTDPSATSSSNDRTTAFSYDVVGNQTQVIDAEGRKTTYTYREDNRLVEVKTPVVTDASGTTSTYVTRYQYDGIGNKISVADRNGNLTQYVYNQNELLRQVTDATGNVTRYSYDANLNQVAIVIGAQLASGQRKTLRFGYDKEDQRVSETDALGGVTRFGLDAVGNRTSVTDANGNTTNYEYDRNNRLLKEIKAPVIDGATGLLTRHTVLHQYDANGNQVAITDEDGRVSRFVFSKDNLLTMATDANGINTVYAYDSRHNRTSVSIGVDATVDASGQVVVTNSSAAQVTSFQYDEFNQVVAKVDGVGNALVSSDDAQYQSMRTQLGYSALVSGLSNADKSALKNLYTSRYVYDRVGNTTQMVDNLGRTTQFSYDQLNRLSKKTDALGQVTEANTYDGNGNRLSQTDALGRTTRLSYDAVNRLASVTDALNVQATRTYDAFGNLTQETQAAGTTDARTTRYEYDLNSRVTRMTDPGGHAMSYQYDAVGNRLKVTDALGNATNFLYDARNRVVKIIDPLSLQTRFEYDGAGNRLTLTDPRGGIQRFAYDAGKRMIETTDAEGRKVHFDYDVRGNRVVQTTAYGSADAQTTQYIYDAENNLRAVVDANGKRSETNFDRVYNRISTKDANGNVTSMAFDALNRTIQVTDAEGAVTRFGYDAVGNRLTQTDALGRIVGYQYDALNRVIQQVAADGVETRYAYDAVSNRVRIEHAAGTSAATSETFTYDLDNLLTSHTDALGHVTRYTYDANHNQTAVIDPEGHATQYQYDADNRVIQIVDAEGGVVRYVYDGNGNRVQVIDARGNASTTYYNANNEVTLSVDAEGYATAYRYDNNGNVVDSTRHMQALGLPLDPAVKPLPPSSPADQVTRYGYDKRNRVISMVDAEGFLTRYTYDAVGNRTVTQRYLDLAQTQSESTRAYYDRDNRLHYVLSAEGYLSESRYDAVGNRIGQIQYDQRVVVPTSGNPVPATGDAGRLTQYQYDANNRLIRQTSALGIASTYSYDARGNQIAMTEAVGTSAARTTTYTYDNANRMVESTDALGVKTRLVLDADGNTLARHEAYGTPGEQITRYTYDRLHRVVTETNAIGVVTQLAYDATGNLLQRVIGYGLPETRTVQFSYNRLNQLVAFQNGENEATTYRYDGAGNRVEITQAPGLAEQRRTSFVYDRDNRLVEQHDALGVVTAFVYDGVGNKLEKIEARGIAGQERRSRFTYDLDNRLLSTIDPLGGATQYSYDVLGNQTRITDALGRVQTNTFDILGRLVSSLSAGGILTANAYDERNNLVSTTQSMSDGSDARTTTYGYDLLNRQTLITDGDGYSTRISYDAFGNQTTVDHALYLLAPGSAGYDAGKAARAFPQSNSFTYDAANRMLSMRDAEGAITTYGYDAIGNRTRVTDGNGNTTLYAFDLANRQVEMVTPEGGIVRATYNEVGDKTAESTLQSNAGSTAIWVNRAFQYDSNGRMVAEIDGDGTRTEHAYDAVGNMLSHRYAAGTADERTVRMEYDLNNRKVADIDALGNRTSYRFDAVGNRIRVTDARGYVARYYFDGANRLASVLDPEGYVTGFQYDAAGNRTEQRLYMTRYTGAVSDTVAPTPTSSALDRVATSTFTRSNREASRIAADGSRTDMRYDGAGNLVTETLFANTSAPRVRTYVYDRDNRLVTFTDVEGTVTQFAYDAASNRTSQTISNPAENTTRVTLFTYDRNNRKVSEIFDPSGFNFVQTLRYDQLGNVISKTDANGHATTYVYDLDNRAVSQTNALGQTSTFGYDAVGNLVSHTDARGNTTNYVYDANNRLTQEIAPQVQTYTRNGGLVNQRPTTVHHYDAAGNEVQTVDPNGFVKTVYFDGNNHQVAVISGDNVLTAYQYDAAGDRIAQTLYMTRVTAAAHDPAVRPSAPSGEARTTNFEYDLKGRLTRTIHPEIEITTLSGTNGDAPVAITSRTRPEERIRYDAFGNAVEIFDKNGNRGLAYYDTMGRKVASVDGAGYLTEFDYDSQDNLLEQRVYATPLDVSSLSTNSRPVAPSGEVYVSTRRFDLANRLVEEITPQLSLFDSATQTQVSERIVTRYSYDAVGNQLSKTLAADTNQQQTEYSYYDAANRRVSLINGNRVVHVFDMDANGNITQQKRFYNAVAASVDLAALNGTTDFSSLVASSSQDQATLFGFDAMNRGISQTDLMDESNLEDNLYQTFRYDAGLNRTWKQDEAGYVIESSYDAEGRSLETISPDGSGTLAQYDAAGNQIYVYTGKIANQAAPASNITAALGSALAVSWDLPAGSSQQSWVVYDTVSQSSVEAYANQTAPVSSAQGLHARAELVAPANGQTVYFRVVSQDIAGNRTWSAERAMVIPPRFSQLVVAEPVAGTLEISARFDSGTVNPVLRYGAPGSLTSSVAFVLQADGSHKATLVSTGDPQSLAYRLEWQAGTGATYASAENRFESTLQHDGVTSNVSQTSVVDGSTTTYRINVATQVPTALADTLLLVSAEWRLAGSNLGYAATAVEGVSSGQGYSGFALTLGDESPLAAGTYEVILRGVTATGDAVLDRFEFTVGGASSAVTRQSLSWNAPTLGDGQLVTLGDRVVNSQREGGRLFIDAGLSTPGTYSYDVRYTQSASVDHSLDLSSTPVTVMAGSPPAPVITGYDLVVSTTLDPSELANVGDGPRLAWRPVGGSFTDLALSASGVSSFDATLSDLAAGNYELKLYYTDTAGREVILSWSTVDATQSASSTLRSQTVSSSERAGSVSLNSAGVMTIDAGLYLGPVDQSILPALGLAISTTGQAAGSRDADGRDTGYAIETQYNALNAKIASGEQDGLWREYGVDANGNIVHTRLIGLQSSASNVDAPIGIDLSVDTYAAFDARNRTIANWDAQTTPYGETAARHAVTRMQYNVLDKVTQQTDAQGYVSRAEFNAIGAKTRTVDAFGNTAEMYYDRLGNQTRSIDELGHGSFKYYDAEGRMIKERDGAGIETAYQYDTFDRRIAMVNGLGLATAEADDFTTRFAWDQRDRLVQIDQAQGWHLAHSNEAVYAAERSRLGFDADANALSAAQRDAVIAQYRIRFEYDGRNNRTVITDARGNQTLQVYDALNRVIDSVTRQGGAEIHDRLQYDAYGNVIAEIDGDGRTTTKRYFGGGRIAESIDAGGVRTLFEYDQLGRVTREYNPAGGKDIRKYYDQAGRLSRIDDLGTGVATNFAYDIAGQRMHEVTSGPHARDISYSYDYAGRLVRVADAVTGMNQNTWYDAIGNQVRVFTDAGWDPDAKNAANNPNYRLVDHVYTFDGANRITQILNQTTDASGATSRTIASGYSYDAGGNRASWNNAGTLVNYSYDANHRVVAGNWSENGAAWESTWNYDANGNVLQYRTTADGVQKSLSTSTYLENNRVSYSNEDGQTTTRNYDLAGHVTQLTVRNNGKTYYYTYNYTADGRESSVRGYGSASGNSTTTYDVNQQVVNVNRGKGDGMSRAEYSTFSYNNEGKILYRFHDDGRSATPEQTEYLYANNNAMGETGTALDGTHATVLDSGRYNFIQNISKDFPTGTVTGYSVRTGDSLQSIAAALYGDAGLWYVLAEANGLKASDSLKGGLQLVIPNHITNASLNADTHRVYNESDIIGSTLPNLQTPPPKKKKGCAQILAIILVVVIAVFAPYLVGALAGVVGPALGVAANSIVAYAVAGAIVGAAVSIVSQGILIAAGLQEKFSWKSVAAGAIGGAFSGAAQGINAAAKAGTLVKQLGEFAQYAKVASVALQVASVAVKQVIETGKITSWTSLAAAGIGQAFSFDSAVAGRDLAVATAAGNEKDITSAQKAIDAAKEAQKTLSYITPWVQLAETAVRNDGKLQPADWANAIGSTLEQAVTSDKASAQSFLGQNFQSKLAVNLLVGGALSAFDKNAGIDYLINSVGNTVGTELGNEGVRLLDAYRLSQLAGEGDVGLRKVQTTVLRNLQGLYPERANDIQARIDAVERGDLTLAFNVKADLRDDAGFAVNARYSENNITINQALVDGAGNFAGAAGLFGAVVEEVGEWAATSLGIEFKGTDGTKLDAGAVIGLMTTNQLAASLSSTGQSTFNFSLDINGATRGFSTDAANLFRAGQTLFTPDRILLHAQDKGGYYQSTAFTRTVDQVTAKIKAGAVNLGQDSAAIGGFVFGAAEEVVNLGVGAAVGIGKLGYDAVGAATFVTLKAVGLDTWASSYKEQFQSMQSLFRSAEEFAKLPIGDMAKTIFADPILQKWDAANSAYNHAQTSGKGLDSIGAWFDYGRALGAFSLNAALAATGVAGLARAGLSAAARLANVSTNIAKQGAAGLEAVFNNLKQALGSSGAVASGGKVAFKSLDDVVSEINRNADVATELARRGVARGQVGSSPQAFGTRAHLVFEGLNERLNRRLIEANSPYRIAVEEFRDAAGIATSRRAAGSVGADVRVFQADTGSSVKVFDLKTYGGAQVPISTSRQQQFINRFGLPANEIYRAR